MAGLEYQYLHKMLAENGVGRWADQLFRQLEEKSAGTVHGDLSKWTNIVSQIPDVETSVRLLNCARVTIGSADDLNNATRKQLKLQLAKLHPWRKGPYDLYGIHIDSEWRSDWKWNRLQNQISSLQNRLVLDVGCGNGYHCWRMLGEGARMVLGIDPTLLSVMQFQGIRKLYGEAPVFVLPLGIEDLPCGMGGFDTVFSMGVLYHRRSPIDHLLELRSNLRSGGELVLETLVIKGRKNEVLLPEGRYANMRNVWFIPSCETLMGWLKRSGFKQIRLLNISTTTSEEQRSTEWMGFHSLRDFLDPSNVELTREGYPAPVRAIFAANVY